MVSTKRKNRLKKRRKRGTILLRLPGYKRILVIGQCDRLGLGWKRCRIRLVGGMRRWERRIVERVWRRILSRLGEGRLLTKTVRLTGKFGRGRSPQPNIKRRANIGIRWKILLLFIVLGSTRRALLVRRSESFLRTNITSIFAVKSRLLSPRLKTLLTHILR